MNILYTIGCPKCLVLEKKLQAKNIPYVECTDVDLMLEKGMDVLPCLEVDNILMNFTEAVQWINQQEE